LPQATAAGRARTSLPKVTSFSFIAAPPVARPIPLPPAARADLCHRALRDSHVASAGIAG